MIGTKQFHYFEKEEQNFQFSSIEGKNKIMDSHAESKKKMLGYFKLKL